MVICVPHLLGGSPSELLIPESVRDSVRVETGDILEYERNSASEIADVTHVNGLAVDVAEERPRPRESRNIYERVRPIRWIRMEESITGRFMDLCAPLGMGCAGIVFGPHGSGLTHTLLEIVRGVRASAEDILPIILLIRPRGEEITHWRRLFQETDVTVCPSAQTGAAASETLRVAGLVLESALRQTELGRHVLLAVDSLSGLWAAMLEAEQADAQREADVSIARRGIREWFQKAGDFTGEGFMGGGIGGSLTLLGTAWSRDTDIEAEEEGELHPEIRLLEHVLPEANWQIALSAELAAERLYPTIDLARSLSRHEENFMDIERFEALLSARQSLLALPLKKQHERVQTASEECATFEDMVASLDSGNRERPTSFDAIRKLLGGEP